ncbi:MAG: hypothetical protein HGA78_09875 [Nitrospirales bacterium]|nr:hypothetical protein [Nitrospirales bacterium]
MTPLSSSGSEMYGGVKMLASEYEVALKRFFSFEDEKALFAVSEIAHELIQRRLGPDVLLDIHTNALKEIIIDEDPAKVGKLAVMAHDVLLHAIMAYAMTYHGLLDMLETDKKRLQQAFNELAEANVKLKELNRLKTVFITSMSHELRTPLNSVIGFSSVLLEEWIGPLNQEQKENLQIILHAGRLLLSLVNDVIDVSKIEAGSIEPVIEELDLAELVQEAVESVSGEMKAKGLSIMVEVGHCRLRTDRRRLLQCLLHLLGNAVKFTEKGGVSVTSRSLDGEKERVEISVADTGVGIKEEDMPKLFQPFSRLDYAINVPGTGLGLYLTKKMVAEILGGDISCSSSFGEGSTFIMKIPVVTDKRELQPTGKGR